jgi:hypothetical protein
MNYEQRWLLAVAMKQPYPRPETGAETPAPPTFTVEEMAPVIETRTRNAAMSGLLIGAISGFMIGTFVWTAQ